ncbi:MAG: 3-deoxy-7-phosphoheptulonate synthase [Rickettsiaceae bacterium H1]|nr:3-deoxy-7-phosphoheptulonate synthase [Rickettsiaceae bacterium H1]
MNNRKWHPNSWRNFHAEQQPMYENTSKVAEIESKLTSSLPIVTIDGVESLLSSLKSVENKKAIVLHGGDCAETFESINENHLSEYKKLVTDLSNILRQSKDVITIGRVAGQFGKPRSNLTESYENFELPIYRGDIINSIKPCLQARKPSPKRLLEGYNHSLKAIKYLEKSGLNFQSQHYVSHEGLLLNYEQCFTKEYKNKYYNLSTHFLWVGNRTRNPKGAHIEYVRGIHNPIGIKIDYSVTKEELIKLINIVNPNNIPGKLTLIFRIGAENIERCLPQLIKEIKLQNKSVILMCDPMHGNTKIIAGKKTRNINTILLELGYFMDILKTEKMHFGGIHLEMTNQKIVECVDENESIQKYASYCDPRLNYKQSIRIADFTLNKLKG